MDELSVLILTKNEERNIGRCLDAVYSQKGGSRFEVLVVDSGSTDMTVEIALRYPVRLEHIPPQAFHHARTRNYAAQLASGKYLVYLAADACPTSDQWLQTLLNPFQDSRVAAVYGRQSAMPHAIGERQMTFDRIYPNVVMVKEKGSKRDLGYLYYHFTTVNAAIRRDVWERTKFPEDFKVFEDLGIAKVILDAGWRIVYEPNAVVYHSHNHSSSGLFKRYFDVGATWRKIGAWNSDTRSSMLRDAWRMIKTEKRTGRQHPRKRVVPLLAKTIGFGLGLYNFVLPRPLKRKFSAFGIF